MKLALALLALMPLAAGAASYTNVERNFGAWRAACKQDPIIDEITCRAVQDYFVIAVRTNMATLVALGPRGSRGMAFLRIDGKPPLSSGVGWHGPDALRILAEMLTAKKVTIRYNDLSDTVVDRALDMNGYLEALDFVRTEARKAASAR